jgi:predicted ester cyclase
MGAADHEVRVRDFFRQVWNGQDYEAAAQLYAERYSNPAAPGKCGGSAKAGFIRSYRQAFPDLTMTIEDLVATDQAVAVRYSATGTDLGGFAGRPPTGRRMTMWAVSFLRFDGDQVISEWIGADYLGLFEDLGTLPSPWPASSRFHPDDNNP